ncbi:MAG: class I SAM-dependent methyltransferase [Paracoccaceae bacterium]|nr:class I SAM-dependent methyltransferase [Paracoccaceae bacterium]
MSNEVRSQYEVYPYPERDPADEAKRLITGSPSLPQEMDHWIWGGARDWTKPLRALVAGGGTGDGLIQLAQMLASAGRPYEITYVDLSTASRAVAEARAAKRRLGSIRFETGSLLNASDFGEFDYIDCCGVLHHLPDPQEGFKALAAALADDGGIGLMVYAPLGRSGVYPLQSAFRRLTGDLPPQEKLAVAKRVFESVPDGHPFKTNPHVVDHRSGDAGFYDLLLHSTDRPFSITELNSALVAAGLELAGVPEPGVYDPAALVPDTALLDDISPIERMQLAENLRGTFKTHVVYAVRAGRRIPPPLGKPEAVPRLRGIDAARLAGVIAKKGRVRITSGGTAAEFPVPKSAARLVAGVNARRSLADLREASRLDVMAFNAAWTPVEKVLTDAGLLHYSKV